MRVALLLLAASGCAYLKPAHAPLTTAHVVSGEGACLVVLLPGVGDSPERFAAHGFLDALSNDAAHCDVLVADSHFGHYRAGAITNRLAALLEPRRAQYRAIWLVGVSLGGYGAMLTAREHPQLIDGVVLISPFLGVPRAVAPVAREIEAAGGLSHYHPRPTTLSRPERHFVEVAPLWAWLAEHARDPAAGPRVVLAYGHDDAFAWKHRLLASSPSVSSISAPGAHDWTTFAALFRQVLVRTPWIEPKRET
ncbi:MAG: alpha/beta fold hydrolase [Archangium sp.]|nr:alpha/beta fold hydrolase [Archangium sp.]